MNKNYIVVQTEDQYKSMLDHIKDSHIIAYDTETTGLNTRRDKVIGFSVSGQVGYGFYFPIYKYDGSGLVPATNLPSSYVVDLLNTMKGKKLVMFNSSFDVRITKSSLGVDLLDDLYADAMLLKHTCDEDFPFGLKAIAKKIQTEIGIDVDEVANQEQLDMLASIESNGGSTTKDNYELYKADFIKIGIYACADTDLTLRVFNHYSDTLKKEGLENFFYRDEVMPLYKLVTIPMESRGVPIDVSMVEKAQYDIAKDILLLEKEIKKDIEPYLGSFYKWYFEKNCPESNKGSFAQAVASFYNLDLPKTKSGKFSLTNAHIEKLPESRAKDYLLYGFNCPLPEEDIFNIQKQMAGDDCFNISSKDHLSKLFFEELGEEAVTYTDKTKKPQMNDLFLSSVADKYEFAQKIRVYNKLNKLKSAYMDRFLERQEDGIFYPSFQQHRTISGRYGSDLQQLPRPIEEASKDKHDPRVYKYTNMVRAFFISGKGYKFIDSDYESLEPHVFSHVSGDDRLKDIFRNGHDFYSTIAIATEGLSGISADKKADNYLGKVDKDKRQKAKAYALGIPYGMEGFALGKNLDIPQKQADKLIEKYLDAYPDLKSWMDRSNEQCKKYGYVRSEAGRIRHMKKAKGFYYSDRNKIFDKDGNLLDGLSLWQKYHEEPNRYRNMKWKRKTMKNYLNNAKNFQIQSLAASITNRACIAIARELKRKGVDGYVCAQVHDQIVVRVPENIAEEWKRIVQYLMENTYKISIKLKAPAELSDNLKEGH
jgi:DNA polymerase I-like protein with 3'-5' exonuclease and polymerase domains